MSSQNNNHDSNELFARLSISDDELNAHKDYLNITPADFKNLKLLDDLLTEQPFSFDDDFFESINSLSDFKNLLGNDVVSDKLKSKQKLYFNGLTKTEINQQYVAERQRIGMIHQKAGLLPRWYIGAYSRYIEELLAHIERTSDQSSECLTGIITALLKIVFFDISLSLDSYHEAGLLEKERLELTGFHDRTRDVVRRDNSNAVDEMLSHALEQSADLVMICDCKGVIEYVNQTFVNITGYSSEETIGRTPSMLKSGLQSEEIYERLWSTLHKGESFSEVIINRKKDGGLYYEEKTITPIIDYESGNVKHYISTGKDISERMDTENRLYFLMHHNAVSGLANRNFIKERLEQQITLCQNDSNTIAIFNLDLDRFKIINDSLGHEVGDMVIQQVASRLKQISNDCIILGHPGGGTFVMVLKVCKSRDVIQDLAEKILDAFVSTFIIESHELFINATIGISTYPEDGESASELLRNSEIAMNRAKKTGTASSSWQYYTADMNVAAHKRLLLESELRKAIENKEFILNYQPQIELPSKKIIGFEALLRWNHPDRGIVSPMEFIPVLEETGLIADVGEWVLKTACTQNALWRNSGLPDVTVAVNFSVVQFQNEGLVDIIVDVLNQTGLPAEGLDVEITESIMMQDTEGVVNILEKLRTQGVQLSMDDFGTGYSSLSQLKKIPINTLKLDQSFVRGLPNDRGDKGITRAIISMGHNLGMTVIAEGVETEEQSSFLVNEGCDSMQGYLFSRPLDARHATNLLKNN